MLMLNVPDWAPCHSQYIAACPLPEQHASLTGRADSLARSPPKIGDFREGPDLLVICSMNAPILVELEGETDPLEVQCPHGWRCPCMLFWHTPMCHLVRYLNLGMALCSAQHMCTMACSSPLAICSIRPLHQTSMLVTSP